MMRKRRVCVLDHDPKPFNDSRILSCVTRRRGRRKREREREERERERGKEREGKEIKRRFLEGGWIESNHLFFPLLKNEG